MTIVTYLIGGDYRSLHRHYYRKPKHELVQCVRDLQKLVGEEWIDVRDLTGNNTKMQLADMCCRLLDRLQDDDDGA